MRILITGGAKRIGAAFAKAFAALGHSIVIHCNNSRAEADELLKELDGDGHQVIYADFRYSEEVDNLFEKLDAPVDMLINNGSMYHKFQGVMAEDNTMLQEFFQVNAFAPISLMRQFAQQNIEQGVIINLLDMEVLKSSPNGGAYSWSRRALKDATQEFARELAPRIRVCGIAPGPVLPPDWAPQSVMANVLKTVPLARAVAVKDIVDTAIFITNNHSITGEIIAIDGGQHIYS